MYVITTYLFIQIITYFVKCFNEKTAVFSAKQAFSSNPALYPVHIGIDRIRQFLQCLFGRIFALAAHAEIELDLRLGSGRSDTNPCLIGQLKIQHI